jgi:hypothetical protein
MSITVGLTDGVELRRTRVDTSEASASARSTAPPAAAMHVRWPDYRAIHTSDCSIDHVFLRRIVIRFTDRTPALWELRCRAASRNRLSITGVSVRHPQASACAKCHFNRCAAVGRCGMRCCLCQVALITDAPNDVPCHGHLTLEVSCKAAGLELSRRRGTMRGLVSCNDALGGRRFEHGRSARRAARC